MSKSYTITLTEEQMEVTKIALEEYFRLRMGQYFDFCTELAGMNVDLSPDNPNHKWLFDMYIARRDDMEEVMRAFFRIAYVPNGHLKKKTDRMLEAETIWDAVRTALGQNRWDKAMQMGAEPLPEIKILDE